MAFYGPVDLEEYLRKNRLLGKYRPLLEGNASVSIEGHLGHHHHWNSMDVQVEYEGPEAREGPKEWAPGVRESRLAEKLREHINEQVKDVSRRLEKAGYEEIEYIEGDEQISDTLIANDYDFTEEGKRW
jgi:hypothetical protein